MITLVMPQIRGGAKDYQVRQVIKAVERLERNEENDE